MSLNLESLKKSIEALQKSLRATQDASNLSLAKYIQESIRAVVIQNFEVAYEQSWKMIKRWLQENINAEEADGITRRELFRRAVENKLIPNVETWMRFHESKNETTHTYNPSTANAVAKTAQDFLVNAQALLQTLQKHND